MMTVTEKFDNWNLALKDQGYQPIFGGDKEAALDYAFSFTDVILAYYDSIINREINLISKTELTESIVQEKDEELREQEMIAESAVAEAIVDMNRVYRAYGIEPMDIDVDDPAAISDFVEDFCNETMQKGIKMLHERDKKDL